MNRKGKMRVEKELGSQTPLPRLANSRGQLAPSFHEVDELYWSSCENVLTIKFKIGNYVFKLNSLQTLEDNLHIANPRLMNSNRLMWPPNVKNL